MKGGANTYLYAAADPLLNIDPNGTNWKTSAAAVWSSVKHLVKTHELQVGGNISAFGFLDGGPLGLSGGISVKGITINFTTCADVGAGVYIGAGVAGGWSPLNPCSSTDGVSTYEMVTYQCGLGFISGAIIGPNGSDTVAIAKAGIGAGELAAAELCAVRTWRPIDW